MEQAREEAASDAVVAVRLDFLELGLRWTEVEARTHTFPADAATADKALAKKTRNDRYALMRDVFQKTPLALNVAHTSWGEGARWAQPGRKRPSKP